MQGRSYLEEMGSGPEELAIVPTGRHGLAPDVVASHQRQRLLAATIELVARRGYRSTSVDHIVKAARVGYVAFYDLFENKEECLLAAFDEIVETATQELEAAAAGEPEWPGQMAAALARLLELIVAEPLQARVALVEIQAAGPDAYVRYERAVDRAVPALRAGRALNPEAAELSDTLEEAVLGGIIWVIHQRLVKGELKETDPLLKETLQIALSPYLGEAEAERLAAATVRKRARRK